MSTKLSWKANSQKRYPEFSKAFHFLTRNVSVFTNFRLKFIAYVGYVIPLISYASMIWFVNKTECKEKERIQKKATELISNSWEMNYKKRLSEFRLLPLSCYFELHDLLTLIILFQGNYKIELPNDMQ